MKLETKNKFLIKNTQYMWKICQVLICTKFKINRYLGKTPSFGALKVAKGYFDAIPGEFCIFSIYRFCPIWAVQSVLWSFSASWRKTDLKTSTTPPKHKIFSLTFNWCRDLKMTLTSNMLTEVLGWYLQVSQTRYMY